MVCNRVERVNLSIFKFIGVCLFLLVLVSFVSASPSVSFISPSKGNLSKINTTTYVFNASIDEKKLGSVNLSFNGSKGSYKTVYYNSTLMLDVGFDNNAGIGDSATVAVDISPQRKNGTIIKASYAAGEYENALLFNGRNQTVKFGNSSALLLGRNGGSFTIEAWIKPVQLTPSKYGIIVGRDSPAGRNVWLGQNISTPGNLMMIVTNSSGSDFYAYTNANTLDINAWQHLVFIFDRSTNSVKIYKNGIKLTLKSSTFPATLYNTRYTKGNFSVGDVPDRGLGTYPFNGSIDEVRVWKRVLSAQEINASYYSNLRKFNASRYYLEVRSLVYASRYDYKVDVFNTSGSSNSTRVFSIYSDNVKPTLSYVAPSYSSGFNSSANVMINVSVTDANNISYGRLYLWNDSGTKLKQINFTGGQNRGILNMSNNFTGLADGIYRLNATANDTFANINLTSTRFVTVDTQKPVNLFLSPTGLRSNVSSKVFNISVVERMSRNITFSVKNNTKQLNSSYMDDSLVWASNFNNNTNLGEGAKVIVDFSRYKNNITIATSNAGYRAGKYGNGIKFGAAAYLRTPAALSLNLASGASNTVEFWMNWQGLVGSYVIRMPTAPAGAYSLYFRNASCFGFDDGSVTTGFSPRYGELSGWHHVVVVFYNGRISSTNNKIYLDGVQQTLTTCYGTAPAANRNITAKMNISDATNPANATLDELRIWNRGITSTEALEYYKGNLQKYNKTYYYLRRSETLPNSAYTFKIQDGDLAKNTNGTSFLTRIDASVPTVSFVSPSSANGYNSTLKSIVINITITDPNNVTYGRVRYMNGSGYVMNVYNITGNQYWTQLNFTHTFTGLANGTYKFGVTANDSFNNQIVETGAALRVITVRTNSPIGTFLAPSYGNKTVASQTFNISISESNLRNLTYMVKNNTKFINVSYYNDKLLFFSNFDNISGLGESATKAVDIASKQAFNLTVNNHNDKFVTGKYGSALNFTARSGANATSMTFGREVTYDFWFRLRQIGVAQYVAGACIDPDSVCGGSNYNYSMMQVTASNYLQLSQSYNYYKRYLTVLSSTTALTTGTWYHVVAGLNMTANTGYIYLNGVKQTVTTTSAGSGSISNFPASGFAVGGYFDTYSNAVLNKFNGTIDNMRIYNRSMPVSYVNMSYLSNLQRYNRSLWYLRRTETLPDSTYNIYVKSGNMEGLTNTTSQFIRVDTRVPVVTFVGKTSATATVYKQNWIYANVSQTDLNGNLNITVYLYNKANALVAKSFKSNATTTYAYNFTGQSDGLYYLNATAFDGLGNKGAVASRNVVLDTVMGVSFITPTPKNGTWNSTQYFNVSLVEQNISTINMSYNLVGGSKYNVTFYDPTLKLYAGFNGNANIGETGTRVMDNSRSYRRGTMVGSPNSKTGRYGNALNFTWHTNYVNFTSSADFNLGSKFTAEAWIAPSDVANGYKPFMGTYNGAGWMFAMNSSSNNALWFYQGNTGYACKDSRCYMIENNLWRHVAVVVSGTQLRFYVNGVNVYNVTAAAFSGAGGELQIGNGGSGWAIGSYGFAGRLDEVKIFNRTLSSNEMKWEYYSSLNRFNKTQWYLQSKLWNDGNQTLTMTANDVMFNVGSSSKQIVQYGYAPFVSLVVPTASAGYYNRTSIRVNVSASGALYKNTRIYLFNKTQLLSSKLFNTTLSFYNFTGLPIGRYYINVTSNNTLDARNSTSTINYVLNTKRPGIAYVSPTPDGYIYSTGSVVENVSVNENVTRCNVTSYLAPADWYNKAWISRKTIYVTSAISTPSAYPVKLVFTQTDLSTYNWSRGCVDFRFTNKTGTLLSYWVRTCDTVNKNATVWVKFDSNVTSSSKYFYMYYGNPTATSTSNGTTTFDFFDDFNGAALDTNKWTANWDASNYGLSSGKLWYNDDASWHDNIAQLNTRGIRTKNLLATAKVDAVFSLATNSRGLELGWWHSTSQSMQMTFDADNVDSYDLYLVMWNNGTQVQCCRTTHVQNTYYDFTLRSYASNDYRLFEGTTQKLQATVGAFNVNQVYFGFQSWHGGATHYVDWVIIKKSQYPNPEPTVSWAAGYQTVGNSTMTIVNKDANTYAQFKPTLTDGKQIINAYCYDVLRFKNSTGNRTFYVDLYKPAVNFINTTNSGALNAATIKANVSAVDTTLTNITINLYNYTSGLLLSRFTRGVQYGTAYSEYNFTSLKDGTYLLNVSAQDGLGRRNTTTSRIITVDTANPQIQFVAPTKSSMTDGINTVVNITASDTNLAYVNFTWTNNTKSKNGTVNYANLVAAINFDRALTQNRTKALWSSRGVVGLWHMDEVSGAVVDYSGSSTCVAHGNMSYGRTGEINKSIYFDGVGDYFNCSSSSTQAVKARGTILMWVKPKTQSNSTYGLYAGCVGAGDAIYAPGYSLSKIGTNGNSIRFNLENTTSSYVQFDMQVPDLKWTFVAVTWDGTRVIGFKNATIINNVSQTANANSGSCTMQIGGSNKITNGYSISDADEVMVVNRALTPQEIMAIYRETQYRDNSKLNGTYTGEFTTASVSGVVGVHNAGFNASYKESNYISAPWRAGLNSSNGTFCAWVKPISFFTGTLFSISDQGSQKSYLRVDLNSNGRIYVSRLSNATTNQVTTGTSKLTAGKWTHVCVSSYASAWKIYYNGVSQSLNVTSGSNNGKWVGDVSSPDNIAFLGYRFQNSSQALANTTIDDILLFNRTLKDDSIFSLYNMTFNLYSGQEVLTFYKNNLKDAMNYTYSALARDGAGNTITTETRWFKASQPVYVTFKKKTPADIDTTNLYGTGVNLTITYNMTSADGIDKTSAQLEYKTNNTRFDGLIMYNGTRSNSTSTLGITVKNVSSNFTFTSTALSVYPGEYPIDPTLFYVTQPKFQNYTSNSSAYKVKFRFMRNDTLYNSLEFMAKNWTDYGIMHIIYCNKSYATGQNFTTTANCIQAGQIAAADLYNHSLGQYDKQYLISIVINVSSGKIRTVQVTNMSYFIFEAPTGVWSVANVPWMGRPDTIQYTDNEGLTWINKSLSLNVDIRQYTGAESFWYRGCIKNTIGGRNCSSWGQDLLQEGGLPPGVFEILSPKGRQSNIVNISHTAALSPNNYAMANYTYTLTNTSFSQIASIWYNKLNRTYLWNASSYNGTFLVKVRACDVQDVCSSIYSLPFFLYNNSHPPVVHIISPSNGSAYGKVSIAISCNATDEFNLKVLGLVIYNGSNAIFRSNRTMTGILFNSQTWNYNFTKSGKFNWTCFASDGRWMGNATEKMYQMVSDQNPPLITFLYPTPGNASYVNSTLVIINSSVNKNVSSCYAQISTFGYGGLDWFNSSWKVRKRFNITSNVGTPRGYQLKIVLTNVTVGPYFDWSRNCSDIRFANKTKGELNYWVKSCDSSNKNATIWVKFDGNITSAVSYFYMYYANKNAVTTSSARNTFFAYDQFENATRMPGCSGQSEGYYYDATNQWIRIVYQGTGVAGGYYCGNAKDLGIGYEVAYKQYTGGVGSNYGDGVGLHSWTTTSGHSMFAASGNGYSIVDNDVVDTYSVYYNGTSLYSMGHYEASGWRDVKVRAFNGNFVRWTNDILFLNWTDPLFASRRAKLGDYIGPYGGSGEWTNEYRIDDLVIRMYVSPEPTIVNGATPEGTVKSNFTMTAVNNDVNTYAYKKVYPSDGSMIYKVFCWDSFFNANNTRDRNVTIDKTKPVLSYANPTVNVSAVDINSFSINVSVVDVNRNHTTVNVYKVGSGLVDTFGGYGASVYKNEGGLVDGYYRFNSSSLDLAGNIGRLGTRNVTVDARAPYVYPSNPGNDTVAVNLTKQFTCNATDTIGVQFMQLKIWDVNGTLLFNNTQYAPGVSTHQSWNFTSATFSTKKWECRASDQFRYNVSKNFTVLFDSIPPLIRVVAPTRLNGTKGTNNIAVNITAYDPNQKNISIRLYYNGSRVGISTVQWINRSFVNFTGLSDGFYKFNASAWDTVGNKNSTKTYNLSLDFYPPVPKQVSPANFTITNVTTRTYVCNATEAMGLNNISLFMWDRFGNLVSKRVKYLSGQNYNRSSWVDNFTQLGKFVWACEAGNGYWFAKSKNFTIYYHTGVPAVSFADPTTASGYSGNSWISINVSASDPLLDVVKIRIYNGSNALINVTTGYNEAVFVNKTGLTDGIYRFNATVNNSLGGVSATGTNFVILDTINPQIHFTVGADNNGTVTRRYINANISVYDVNLQRAYVRLYNMSGAIVANRSIYTTTNVRFDNLFQGRYFLNASAFDDAGRRNFTNTRNITVQLIGPDYRFIGPTLSDQSYSRYTSILANLTAYDSIVSNSTLWLWNTTELVDSYYCGANIPCFHNFSGLVNGIYYLNASGYNNLGQLGNSITHQIRLSTIPPKVVINGPISGNYTNSAFIFNMTMTGSALDRFNMSWDNKTYRINYSFYGDGLVWAAGLDHNVAIGDTLTEVRDYSVYSNNGTITGATYTAAKYSNGMYFNVGGRKVKVNGVPVNIAAGGKNTVEFWFYRNGHGGPDGYYPQTVPFAFNNMYALDWQSYHCFGFDSGVGTILGFDSAGLDGGWHHVAVVFYNGIATSSNSKIYIDGVQRGLAMCNGGQTQAYKTAASTFWIGNVNDNAGLPWDGIIDEVRVWNKELGAAQILQDYYSNMRVYNETRMTFVNSQSLLDGNYTFRGYATSRYGLSNFSTVKLDIDTTRPTSAFVVPTTSSGYRSKMWISANVTASDRNGIGGIVIKLYNDTNSLVGASSSGSSPLFYNFTNLQNGIYKINYTVSDTFGWKNIQSYRMMTLDNVTPRTGFIFPSSSGNTYGFIPPINMTINERNLNYTNYTVIKVGSYVKNYTIFDGSLVFMSSLDGNAAIGETGSIVVDVSRHRNNGTLYGSYVAGRHGNAISGYVIVNNVNTNQQLEGNNTVDFWTYYSSDGWKFTYNNGYGIRKIGDCMGVSSNDDYDIMGVAGLASIYTNKWIHVVAVIPNGVTMPSNTRMFINGKLYPVSYCSGNSSFSSIAGSSLFIGGSGYVDEFRIFNRGLSVDEILHDNVTVFTKMNRTRWNLAIWDSPATGNYTSRIYAMDRVGLSNYSTMNYMVNRSSVIVGFVYPTTSSGNTTNNWIAANVTASAPLGVKVIKLFVLNASNSLFNRTTVYNSTNLYVNITNMPNGLFRLNMTANDTLDNKMNDSRRVVNLDLVGITIGRTSPSINNSYIRTSYTTLRIDLGDNPSYCNVNWNGTVYAMTPFKHGNKSYATYYLGSLADAKNYTYSYQCQNYVGVMNSTKNYTVYVGWMVPRITIYSPVNNSKRIVSPVLVNYSVAGYQHTWWGYEYEVPCGKHTCTRVNNYTYSSPVIYNALDGTNVLWFFANDTINNNASKRISFDVDTVHPTITYIYPTPSNGRVMNGNSTYVNVSISEGASKCNLVVNGTNSSMTYKQSCISNLPCVYYAQINKSLTFDRLYSYHVWCNDTYGNGANSSTMTVIASSAMKLAYISKTDVDGLSSSKNYLQVNTSFSTQDLLNATLRVYKDGVIYNRTIRTSNGYLGFNFTDLPRAVYAFNVTAYNAHRNRAVLPSHTVGLFNDSVPPVVHMVSPSIGFSSSAMVQNFICNITDDKAVYNVSFYLYNKYGILLTRNISIVTGIHNVSTVSMVLPYEKGYNWTCKGSDIFNKVWAPEGLRVIYRDYQPPTLLYVAGTTGSYSNSRTLAIVVNASDLTLNTVIARVYNDSSYLLNTSSVVGSGPGGVFTFNVPVTSDGIFIFNMTANDSLNRISKLYPLQTLIDTVKPNINWTGGTTLNGTFTRTWIFANITSADAHKSHDTTWLYRNGVLYASHTSYGSQYNFTNLPSGNYQLYATVYDLAGNTNTTSIRYITLNVGSPNFYFTAPTPETGSNSSLTSIAVNMTTTDPFQTYNLTLYKMGSGIVGSKFGSVLPAFRNFTGLTDGVYVYNLTANNSQGNRVASLSENRTLDTWTSIAFVSPTPPSENNLYNNLTVNVTIVERKVVEIGMAWFDGIKRYNTTVFDNNLLQMISFNNEINDHSLYNNSVSKHDYYAGKPINAWINTSYVGGKYGAGIGLSTSESIVHLGHVFPQRMSFTEAFWMERGNDQPQTIATNCPFVITDYENHRLRVHVQSMQDYGLTVNTPVAGNWYYVAITFNKDNNETKVFINGNLTGYIAAWDPNYPMVWGQDCQMSGGVNYWESPMNGAIDEWRVWNRSLSPGDIAQLYRTNLMYVNYDNVKWNNKSTWRVTRSQNKLDPANYTYSMYDVDENGNINNTGVRWYNLFDNIPPVLSYVSPTYAVKAFRRTSILMNVTSYDGHLKNVSIFVFNSSGLVAKHNTNESPDYYNFSGLPDGVYHINASSWDSYNNKGYLDTRQIILDNVVPVVQFVYPTTANDTDRHGSYIAANVTSGDLNRNRISIRLYSQYGLSKAVNSSSGASVLFYNFTGLGNGWYYMNASANDTAGNTAYTGTHAIYITSAVTERVSLNYTMPGIGCTMNNGCRVPGCTVCTYPAFNTSKFQQYNVSPRGQNMTVPFWNITNNGTVAINVTLQLNQTSYPGVKFKVSTTRSGGIEHVCSQTYTPSVGCMYIVDTSIHVLAVNVTPGYHVQAWLYSDFVGVPGGTLSTRNVSINATRFQNP